MIYISLNIYVILLAYRLLRGSGARFRVIVIANRGRGICVCFPLFWKEIIGQSDVVPKGVGEVLIAFVRPLEEGYRAHWIISEKSGDVFGPPVRVLGTGSLKDSHHRSLAGFIFQVDRTGPPRGTRFPV